MSARTKLFAQKIRTMVPLPVGILMLIVLAFGCDDYPHNPDPTYETIVLQGGVPDEFSTDNSEPVSVHPDFLAHIRTKKNPLNPVFDGWVSNRTFGHSFILPACFGERKVKSARVTMRLRALSGDAGNDQTHWHVRDGQGGTRRVWGASIANHLNNGSWRTGEVRTFEFDLSAMPQASAPGIEYNLLPYLEDGEIHIYIQDDTSVDFIRLEAQVLCDGDGNDGLY